MPTTCYTQEEVDHLLAEIKRLSQHLANAEAMRPHWAQGYSTDSIAAQTTAASLNQVWDMLHVTNQTDCIKELTHLLRINHDL